MNSVLEIAGATLTINDHGVNLRYGWMVNTQIQMDDALKIRDWLNINFPPEKPK